MHLDGSRHRWLALVPEQLLTLGEPSGVKPTLYAQELSRYLHLNPVRAKMVARPEDYPWSSYRAYVGLSPSPEWLRREWILGRE